MPRIKRETVAKPPRNMVIPSAEEQQAGIQRRQAWEQANEGRFQEPTGVRALLTGERRRQRQVSQQFKSYASGADIKDTYDVEKHGLLPLDYEPVVKHEIKKRKAETTKAATQLGSGPSWEEIHPERQSAIEQKLAAHGITRESAHRAYRAQVLQALGSARENNSDPYASGFYHNLGYRGGVANPRQQVENTARDFNVPFHVAAVAHAMMSPQLPFERRRDESTFAHNDDAARQALHFALSGADITNLKPRTYGGADGKEILEPHDLEHLHPNARNINTMQHTVHVVRQLMNGVSLDKVKNLSGKDPFGDKTGAYLHAFLNPESPHSRTVVDTHTVMGFAPHLNKDAEEHTAVLGIDGSHAFFHSVAQDVMRELGLKSAHQTQEIQWGQERINAGQVSAENAYRPYTSEDTISHVPLVSSAKENRRKAEFEKEYGSTRQGTLFD